jgi:hypothetical protein
MKWIVEGEVQVTLALVERILRTLSTSRKYSWPSVPGGKHRALRYAESAQHRMLLWPEQLT